MLRKTSIGILVFITTFLVWLPFIIRIDPLPFWGISFKDGMDVIFKNFDGPNYLIIAKTWYQKDLISTWFSNPLPLEYYPAHLPFYPLTIKFFDLFLPGTWSMLFSTLLGSILAYISFYSFLLKTKYKQHAYWITILFLFLPARFLAVRSIGSPEPWFIFFIISSIASFKEEKYLKAGLFGALAQLTKSPGILLFASFVCYLAYKLFIVKSLDLKKLIKTTPLLLIPLSALALFSFYQFRTGDFFAYFNSGDNFHLFLPPFSIFSPKGQFWTGDFWLEDIIFIWLIFGLGIIKLLKRKLYPEFFFSAIFFSTTLLIGHRDISRYIIPIAPFALLGLVSEIKSKEFKVLTLILILPIYFYTWNFLLNNLSPVADWTPYL